MQMTYEKAKANIDHLAALGVRTVHLYPGEDLSCYPWHLVRECEGGCAYRMESPVSIRFTATEEDAGDAPDAGKATIKYVWEIDLEPRGSNGTSELRIDADLCLAVMKKVSEEVRHQFAKLLIAIAETHSKRAAEHQRHADTNRAKANLLISLCAPQ